MDILYVCMRYDYGDRARGLSFEHNNFYDALVRMGHSVEYFDFMELHADIGPRMLNRRLSEVVRSTRPDTMFTFLYNEELSKKTVREISDSGLTQTVNWFGDDHWRFDNFSRHWAPCFNWNVTTDAHSLTRYDAELGLKNVILSQWACNHNQYRKLDLPLKYDVTFVGQPHSNRPQVVSALRQAGIDVRTWGNGWKNGRVSQEGMIEIFNQSLINLNLSNSSVVGQDTRNVSKIRQSTRQLASRALSIVPYSRQLKNAIRGTSGEETFFADTADPLTSDTPLLAGALDQIKGRNFEVPGTGGCLLTAATQDLDRYYEVGKEVICYDGSMGDLIEQVKWLLNNRDYCQSVAQAGHRRTLDEHTYEHRFQKIFEQMGLPAATDLSEPHTIPIPVQEEAA